MTSRRPYLIRAMYDWILDNNTSPWLTVDAQLDNVEVPAEYVEDGRIILNISPISVRSLELGNEYISFSARFSGRSHAILLPVEAIIAIYARETGEGMLFTPEDEPGPPEPDGTGSDDAGSQSEDPETPERPHLKVVK